ncbi:TRAP transporter large permease subunit [Oceanobacillus piezotolerans]|uniref:TRAP transporter large permease subunit n=1 Tax=Oceanobacillus piezotolerans TaxID=2448030 RepID=A0A498DK44_9BACI|nr:TRAP transporter large permease subunit [Oceanobacillus piezotolerans]RLL46852.1 TRAP transporter large permease subunit [Oceanobacillus piezotolerans]
MGEIPVIIITLTLFIALLSIGLHISTVLLLSGIVGIYLLSGVQALTGILELDPFNRVASYTLTTIPLFILMSQFIMHADIVKYLYSLVFKLTRGVSSVLGVFTILLGGFLGAVSGSGSAISASLGQIAVPELKKRGYKEDLAGAIAAVSGSLSSIIPPAIGLIIYGALTQTPIGDLFIASIIPGILMIIIFIIVLMFLHKRSKREVIETEEAQSIELDNYSAKQYTVAILTGLFIVGAIFGGIYLGIFTPTEAGAVGAFISLITAAILGKVNVNFIKKSLRSTLEITTMVMVIMIGAQVFGKFISLSRIPRKVLEMLEPLMGMPLLIIILLLIIYFILFMFLEGAAVILMTVPITVPLAQAVGISPLEFGILISAIGTAGLLTPPVGLCVYSVAGVTKIPIENLFKYSLIFATAASIAVPAILLNFPELMTFLVNNK